LIKKLNAGLHAHGSVGESVGLSGVNVQKSGRALVSLAGVAVVLSGVAALPVASESPARASSSIVALRSAANQPLVADDSADASKLAVSTGQPVEILADRTDFAQTFAEPSGGYEESESLVPERVQQADGSWVPINTTLSVLSDGQIAPGAITAGLNLSDGGSRCRMAARRWPCPGRTGRCRHPPCPARRRSMPMSCRVLTCWSRPRRQACQMSLK